jgi:hypothetical protein
VKVLAMTLGEAGAPDLVHHTVRHFLDPEERGEWARIPAGAVSPTELGPRPPVPEKGRPPRYAPTVDARWWQDPWRPFAVLAHDNGYAPRYRFLVGLLGPLDGSRWEPAERGRRVGDVYGFRTVVAPRGDAVQMVTAFFSTVFRHDDQPGDALRAFAAFAGRADCPFGAAGGVPPSRRAP